jgi:cytochrome P450
MTLASTFFYLMTNPDAYKRLRQEIDETIPTDVEVPDSVQVAKLPYLAAVL